MTQQEITAGEAAIAKFDGWEFINDAPEDYPNGYWMLENEDEKTGPYRIEEMEYHTSPNWIWDVITKIEKLDDDGTGNGKYAVEISTNKCVISEKYGKPIIERKFSSGLLKIEMVFKTIVDFIKWYELNK